MTGDVAAGEPAASPAAVSAGQIRPRLADAEWEARDARAPSGAAPVLSVDGFEGPLDWLLEMARAQRIDLAKLSIVALIGAFTAALDTALTGQRNAAPDALARWGDWTVMAANLTLLRSRLLLPPDAQEAKAAQDEAEALRRQLVERAHVNRTADWLERRPQLGRDVFRRGSPAARAGTRSVTVTDLLRACLVALRLPARADAYQLRTRPLWRVSDAIARITEMLGERPGGRELGAFLPGIEADGPDRDLRCRAAVASTLLAGLELARGGALILAQENSASPVMIEAGQKLGQ